MKCLVTGGLGFIGSHLVERLAELGHDVTIFDLVLTPKTEFWTDGKGNIRYPNITYHTRDITQPSLHNFRCDWCFHLAALADVRPSLEYPWRYHHTNVTGTVNVLDHAVRLGVKRFIYASTDQIYGMPTQYPTPESAPAAPLHPYGFTKYIAEKYVMHWSEVFRLPAISLRLSLAYGPRMKTSPSIYGSVFKVFMAQKANNAPFTVIGDGTQSRDFIFVSDVVDAFIRAAESNVEGEVFNISGGEPQQITRLVYLLGVENGISYVPKRPGEPHTTFLDIRKARQMLGWKPKVSFEEGVKIMLENLISTSQGIQDDWRDAPVWTPETIEKAQREWFRLLGPTKSA